MEFSVVIETNVEDARADEAPRAALPLERIAL